MLMFFTDRYVPHGEWVIMKSDGSEVQRLFTGCVYNDGSGTFYPYCASPRTWLPDGEIVFSVDDYNTNDFSPVDYLAVFDPRTQTYKPFTASADFPLGSRLSPGASLGVYVGSDGSLYTATVATGASRQIMPACAFPTTCGEFTWSPDGGNVFAPRDGSIVEASANGEGSKVLYSARSGALSSVTPSPDGSYLVFLEGDTTKLLRLDGSSSPSVLTTHATTNGLFAWSPDSKSIAFGSNYLGDGYDFSLQVTVMNISGASAHVVSVMPSGTGALSGLEWGK
jgi:Tol biopolymer transport system component